MISNLSIWAYGVFMRLAQPLLRRKLHKRAQAEPLYGQFMEERFGHYTQSEHQDWIWIHAVSLGETRTAAILLEGLRKAMPEMKLLLTNGTATGREEGRKLLQEGEPHQLTNQLLTVAADYFSAPAEISDMDGLRVDWPDGFGLIRASNTTPVLVLRFEGHTEAALHRIENDMLTLLRTVKPDASLQSAAH